MRLTFIILALIIGVQGLSQDRDFQIWAGVNFSHKFSKKLSASVGQDVRTGYNSQLIKKVFTQASVTYKVIKPMKITLGYRHNFLFNEKTSAPVKRLFADFVYSKKIKKFKPSVRLRYQRQWDYESFSNTFRVKLKTAINLPKTKVNAFVSGELFKTVFRPMDKFRYTFGIDRSLNKKIEAKLYYRFQKEINQTNVEKVNIVGLGVSFKI
ncbi:MAG: hypothetical protein ACI9J3_003867 [Parvicellaceae bacterium]|jgi:hypothetical protein